MTTQMAERQELIDTITILSDKAIERLASYAEFLKYEDGPILTGTMSAETREAVKELSAGKGHRAHSVKELMAALHDDKDD
jgi:hypothetical protein